MKLFACLPKGRNLAIGGGWGGVSSNGQAHLGERGYRNHLVGDCHLSETAICRGYSRQFQASASWGRAAVLFGIARATQLTAREVQSRQLGWLSLNGAGVCRFFFTFEEPYAAVSRRESSSHRIGCEIIPFMTTACVVIQPRIPLSEEQRKTDFLDALRPTRAKGSTLPNEQSE
jgi:hypothetical protein